MKYLTLEEHREVVERLVKLLGSLEGVRTHEAGVAYTSLMACFAMHSKGAAESVLALHDRFTSEWFPATTGYLIVRSLFEVDVLAHYITKDPIERARQYISFGQALREKRRKAVERHRASDKSCWREGTQPIHDHEFAPQEAEAGCAGGSTPTGRAKKKLPRSWSGKSLREMAEAVDHVEAYDIFYADLSSFSHVDVRCADRFLRVKGLVHGDGPGWSQRADEFDVANTFRYAATFLTCFLELFGEEFELWGVPQVRDCWEFPESNGREPRL